MSQSLAAMVGTCLAKEETAYIEEMLKACNDALPIKTYAIVQAKTFEDLKKQIDQIVENNPMMEIAGKPLNLNFLDLEKWIAILVEYIEEANGG